MRKVIASFGLFLIVLSCSSENTKQPIAVGGPIYGGTLNMLYSDKVNSLFPLAIETVYQQRLSNQIFETLLKFNNDGNQIIPSLCESYKIENEGKTYTFKIRKNVYFQDNPCFANGKGRLLTAEDVKFSLEFACSGLPENKVFHLFEKIIDGAEEFQKNTKKTLAQYAVSGIKVIDKHTISINLKSSFGDFEKVLTHSSLGIFPKEAYQKYGTSIEKNPVGTGAFQLKSWTNEEIKLIRNERYWKKDNFGNQLPYLNAISIRYSKNKKAELEAFKAEKIDLILNIPANEIENTIGTLEEAQAGKNVKHKLYSKKSLSVNFLAFTNHTAPFNNIDVRRAFNLAIDRNQLIKNSLDGQGYEITNGFVPAIEGYPSEKIQQEKFNILEAKKLLLKAGYPNGEGFPEVEIYTNTNVEGTALKLIQELKNQIKDHLNIDLKIVYGGQKERLKAISQGKAVMWKNGWVADYPDPLSFLESFRIYDPTSPFSFDNQQNSDLFATILAEATVEKNDEKRNELYLKCDQMIVDQLPVILLYNDDFISMANAKVRNFKTNSLEQMDFSILFISNSRKKNQK
ncbi:MAG: ABC transporter substrate-binding protein [Crocinitomicaceae bacterium]|nr:ABC transporter substrate-binding protein [Crocinitomicaceae bacterium]